MVRARFFRSAELSHLFDQQLYLLDGLDPRTVDVFASNGQIGQGRKTFTFCFLAPRRRVLLQEVAKFGGNPIRIETSQAKIFNQVLPVKIIVSEEGHEVVQESSCFARFLVIMLHDFFSSRAARTTIIEDGRNRRADLIVFVNGLPLAVIELKNPGDENATVKGAFNQLQTYKRDIPSLFTYNELLVASDGLLARAGTLTADWERFMPWRTVGGDEVAPKGSLELDVLIKGIFEKSRFVDLINNFIVFEDEDTLAKKMAGYHQFHAVNKAVQCTLCASSMKGDRRAGVIWHTQGSGKSLSMLFYAGKLIQHPKMENPTLVVLTDRIDLDASSSARFPGVSTCCDKPRCRLRAGMSCATCCKSPPVVWYLRPSRSFSPRSNATSTRLSRLAATSS